MTGAQHCTVKYLGGVLHSMELASYLLAYYAVNFTGDEVQYCMNWVVSSTVFK